MIDLTLIGLTRLVVGARALWVGSEPGPRQRIYFANHSSHLDTLLIMSALPRSLRRKTRPVAAADYWSASALRRIVALRGLNALLVERRRSLEPRPTLEAQASEGAGGAAPDALAPLREALGTGWSLVLFPEGTRGPGEGTGGPLGPFRSGLYRLACEFPHVELVPAHLENPARALPKGEIIPVPIACAVRFGAPLARIEGEAKDTFLARARDAVAALAPEPPR